MSAWIEFLPKASAWLAMAFLFSLACGIVQAEPSRDELKALDLAKRSYADGLFEVADQRFTSFLSKYPASELKGEAQLTDGQALYYLARYEAALPLFDSAAKSGQTAGFFWLGESFNALQRWPQAEAAYRTFIGKVQKDDLKYADAQLGLSWSLLRQDKEKDARDLLNELSDNNPKSEAGQNASLLLAKNLINKKQNKEAVAQLKKLLALNPKPKVLFEASYLLGELSLQDNHASEAVENYQRITGNPKAFPKSLIAQAWFGIGTAYRSLNQNDKAMAAFEQAYTFGDWEQLKMAAFRNYLQSARALKRLPEAVTKLQDFSKKNSDNPTASAALFAIGQMLAENKEGEKAIGILEAMLVAYPKSTWRAPANFLLGGLYQQSGKPDNALAAYQQCIEASDNAELTRKAQFEAGRVASSQKDFDKAIGFFDKVQSIKDDLGEDAGYLGLIAASQQDKIDPFQKALDRFNGNYPKSKHLAEFPLLLGTMQQRLGLIDQARATYEKAIAAASGDDKAQLTVRLGDLLAQAGKNEEAWQVYEQFATQFPNDPAMPDVSRKGIVAGLAAQKIPEEQALQALQALQAKYPKDANAPEILFLLGELYWNRQDYVNAQNRFEQVASQYPKSSLMDDALLWAGKAAVKHNALTDAVAILEKLPESSPLKSEARLLQANIFLQQFKFDNALKLCDAVLDVEKSGLTFVNATMSKGNALYALGGKEYSKYEQAAAAYGVILNGNQGNFLQRNEAAYRRAKCFEMLKRREDALALYIDILNGRFLVTPDGQPATPPPEFVWQVKAGLDAARLKEEDKDWRGAIQIYRKLEQLGGPNQQEFRDSINRIRRDNYLYD
jgi:TolA-binding protein